MTMKDTDFYAGVISEMNNTLFLARDRIPQVVKVAWEALWMKTNIYLARKREEETEEMPHRLTRPPEKEVLDPVVERVVEKMRERSRAGIKKYGCTVRDGGSTLEHLDEAIEEALDLAIYLQDVKEKLENLIKTPDFSGGL
jgi:hypothetical protein